MHISSPQAHRVLWDRNLVGPGFCGTDLVGPGSCESRSCGTGSCGTGSLTRSRGSKTRVHNKKKARQLRRAPVPTSFRHPEDSSHQDLCISSRQAHMDFVGPGSCGTGSLTRSRGSKTRVHNKKGAASSPRPGFRPVLVILNILAIRIYAFPRARRTGIFWDRDLVGPGLVGPVLWDLVSDPVSRVEDPRPQQKGAATSPRPGSEPSYIGVQTAFTSVYCSSTSWPISRPQPDCLYPPKGSAASKML